MRGVTLLYRAGQELGAGAVLVPLEQALTTLQRSIGSDPSLLGPITGELLAALAEAPVFQELCSGDMSAVPGLTSNSRLSCLLDFLRREAEWRQSGLQRRAGQNGRPQGSSKQPVHIEQADEHAHTVDEEAHDDRTINGGTLHDSTANGESLSDNSSNREMKGHNTAKGGRTTAKGGHNTAKEGPTTAKGGHTTAKGGHITAKGGHTTAKGVAHNEEVQKAGSPDGHPAQQSVGLQNGTLQAVGKAAAEESESLDSFISVDTADDGDSSSQASALDDQACNTHALVVVAEQVTAHR